MSSGQFILQQSATHKHYATAFNEFREAEEFLDVTLACDDEMLSAHKVVLSANSPFFRKIILKTNQPHPFIYLKGVKFEDLKIIMNFIYNSEAYIAAKDINRFMETAQELEIQGLATEKVNEKKAMEM